MKMSIWFRIAAVFWAPTIAFAAQIEEKEIAKMRQAMPTSPIVAPQAQRRLLVFSLAEGFQHSSIPYWDKALDLMGQTTGAFTLEISRDKSIFSNEQLERFDAICLNNTTKLILDEQQRDALLNFVEQGKGLIGIHAATDSFYDWPEGAYLLGGQFSGHPWNANGVWAIKIDQPDHPLTAMFDGKGFQISDEIYRTHPPFYSRAKQRVLMSLDFSDQATRSVKDLQPDDWDTGISWIKPYGKGRVFYCSLGHNHDLTWTPKILTHYLAGIQYALGDLKVDDTPIADLKAIDNLIEQIRSYRWGQSRRAITMLEEAVRLAGNDRARLDAIEAKLTELLSEDTPLDVKDPICRVLARIGSSRAVPALAKLLDDPQTEHLARLALQQISDPAAEQALLDKLTADIPSQIKAAVIHSLGMRRSQKAIEPLGRVAVGFDPVISNAAIGALGLIGAPEAAEMLRRIAEMPLPQKAANATNALVVCASRLAQDGKTELAAAVYDFLAQDKKPMAIQIVGIIGLAETNPAAFAQRLPAILDGRQTELRAAAIRQIALANNPQAVRTVLEKTDQFSDNEKQILLAALADGNIAEGAPFALQAAADPSSEVRLSAYHTLAVIGKADSVLILAQAAAKADQRGEKEAARAALASLSGQGVRQAFEKALRDSIQASDQQQVAVELIRAIGQRADSALAALLFEAAGSASGASVVNEALRAIQTVADFDQTPKAVELLVGKPSPATEETVYVLASKSPHLQGRAAALLAKWDSAEPAVKAAFLRLMGRLGDPDAIPLIEKTAADADVLLAQAARDAMINWPNAQFIEPVRQMAFESADMAERVKAFRGYLRMIVADADASSDEKIALIQEAIQKTARPAEQKLALAALAQLETFEALDAVIQYKDVPELAAEAQAAMITLCSSLASADLERAKAALIGILEKPASDALRQRAEEMISKLDFIVVWQVAGPFRKRGQDERALFDIAFLPETDPDKAQWRLLRFDGGEFGYMDLLKAIGGANRVAYARTTIIAPQAMDVQLQIGSDDGVKVWLNGKVVHENNTSRGHIAGEDKIPVRLQEGENILMLKITQGQADWGFSARFTYPDGRPIPGLKVKP